jgi:hypothetical protein
MTTSEDERKESEMRIGGEVMRVTGRVTTRSITNLENTERYARLTPRSVKRPAEVSINVIVCDRN